MNAEETRKAAEVMMAAADGRPVQFRRRGYDDTWALAEGKMLNGSKCGPLFNWQLNEYRIAPEPREWWVNFHSVETGPRMVTAYLYDTERQAQAAMAAGAKIVHVREVLED